MRAFPLRTISGRIVVGFFVLMATFGLVSVYSIHEMNQIIRELRFLRGAQLEISLRVARLQSFQAMVVDYLDSTQLVDPRLKPSIKLNLNGRKSLLEESRKLLDNLGEIPERHRDAVSRMQDRITFFLTEYETNAGLYELAFSAELDEQAALGALQKVEQNERRLAQQNRLWFDELRGQVEALTGQLEEKGEKARVSSLVLGGLATLVGLLATLWAVLTLRPLMRLRDGARRVARGEYRDRIEVPGQTEVAEVAREFNAMAEAVEEREQELVRSARLAAIGKMAAVITHEIRNPLSAIGLNVELLEEEIAASGSGESRSLLKKIHDEVNRLTGITEEYLKFARMPRPKLDLEQINTTVADVVEFVRSELAQSGIETRVSLEKDLPRILADEGQIRQAMLNLIRNAADALKQKGSGALDVSTRRADAGGILVTVADTGPGIPDADLPHIFEPFFSTKTGGTGLGLALTHQIISEHGGKITVDSRQGEGTTFVVELPGSG